MSRRDNNNAGKGGISREPLIDAIVQPCEVDVYFLDSSFEEHASKLAEHLGSRAMACPEKDLAKTLEGYGGLALTFSADGLALVGDGMMMRADFESMLPRLKSNSINKELLVKASRIRDTAGNGTAGSRKHSVFDATAGLGEDSLLLAAAGFDVYMHEHNPIIAALLADAIDRAQKNERLLAIVSRMHPYEDDSIEALRSLASNENPGTTEPWEPESSTRENIRESTRELESAGVPQHENISQVPDVILLDPMFPARTKSAKVKKKFQLLHHLEEPCGNEHDLLQAAIMAKPRKIVIKRTPNGPWLDGVKPDYSIEGKSVRYDCIIPAARNF